MVKKRRAVEKPGEQEPIVPGTSVSNVKVISAAVALIGSLAAFVFARSNSSKEQVGDMKSSASDPECALQGVPAPPQILHRRWRCNITALRQIREAFRSGRPVVISEAFDTEFAESLAAKLHAHKAWSLMGPCAEGRDCHISDEAYDSTDRQGWCGRVLNGTYFQASGSEFRYKQHKVDGNLSVLKEFRDIMSSPAMLAYMEWLLQPTYEGAVQVLPWKRAEAYDFRPGDHFGMHQDYRPPIPSRSDMQWRFPTRINRVVAATLQLTKGWDGETQGGRLIWCRLKTFGEHAQTWQQQQMRDTQATAIPVGFNKLVLFRVDSGTFHFVEKVWSQKGAPRLSIQGWWLTLDQQQQWEVMNGLEQSLQGPINL
mmetsp:Transcript_107912/g.207494  ORF Transcript_107912/g.207494 Transcript_107912/m.207494 type:complete len:370 (+) Transcript_107912:141-1250(+)